MSSKRLLLATVCALLAIPASASAGCSKPAPRPSCQPVEEVVGRNNVRTIPDDPTAVLAAADLKTAFRTDFIVISRYIGCNQNRGYNYRSYTGLVVQVGQAFDLVYLAQARQKETEPSDCFGPILAFTGAGRCQAANRVGYYAHGKLVTIWVVKDLRDPAANHKAELNAAITLAANHLNSPRSPR